MSYAIEKITDQALACGEGPVWDPSEQKLYWTDSGGQAVYIYDPITAGYETLFSGTHAAALTLCGTGGLLLGGEHGFYTWNKGDILRVAKAKMINEIIADPAGRVFGGQEAYKEPGPYQTGFLFRLDPGGDIRVVEEGLHNSNGMGFSPDLSSFYLTDTILRCIYRYDYDLASGKISKRKLLIRLSAEQGLPDGMTVDSEGFIWVASWFGGCLLRFDPDGRMERKIELPFVQPTSLTFGGKDYCDIFVTSAAAMWQTPLAPPGHNYRKLRGGALYRIRQDIAGLPEYRAWV